MTQLLTDDEILSINQDNEVTSYRAYARAIEAAVLDRLSKQEPIGEIQTHTGNGEWCAPFNQAVFKDGLPPVGTKLYAAPVPPVKQEPVAWMNPYEDDSGEAFHWEKGMTTENRVPLFAAPVPQDPRIAELEAALLEQVDLTIQLRDQLNQLRASLDPSRE